MFFNTPSRIILVLIAFTVCASAAPPRQSAHRPGERPLSVAAKTGNLVLDPITLGDLISDNPEFFPLSASRDDPNTILGFANDVNLLVNSETHLLIKWSNIAKNQYAYFEDYGIVRLTDPLVAGEIVAHFIPNERSLTTQFKLPFRESPDPTLSLGVGLHVEFSDSRTLIGRLIASHFSDGLHADFELVTYPRA